LREAQEATVARGLLGHEQDFLDSLAVMEEGMRHFYVRAIAAKQTKQPDKVIDAAMIQAVQIAEKVAPYRHELRGHINSFIERLHPDDRAAVKQSIAEYRAGVRPKYRAEFRLRHKDDSWRAPPAHRSQAL
jgi:PAS fold